MTNTVTIPQVEYEALLADKRRLDSKTYVRDGFDEFGEIETTLCINFDLRAAIDKAMEQT